MCRKVPHMLSSTTSKWGRNGEERAALLRVRTRPECPEGNWRGACVRQQGKLWDSKTEKINRPTHTAGRSQNKGSEQVQRRDCRLWTSPAPPETGGRGEGKGANLAPKMASPTTLQTGLQFLTKDFLRFWMVNIHWEGHSETQGAGTRPGRAGTGAGAAEGRRRPSSSWLPELLRPGKAQNAGPTEPVLLWST